MDAVITTRELVKMMRSAHISPETLQDIPGDSPMQEGTGAGVIGYPQMRRKQTMLSASRKHILLADSHKFGLQFLSVICPLSEIDLIITDSGLSAAKLEAFQKQASVLRSGS